MHATQHQLPARQALNRLPTSFPEAWALLSYGFRMRRGFFVDRTAVIDKRRLVKIARRAEIGRGVIIRTSGENSVAIGEYTQINPYTVIYGGQGVSIGNNVLIAPHCVIAAGNHDYKQTALPMRHAGNLGSGPIVIEDDVWLGAHVTVTDGVRIGQGAVVAANAVVTRNVDPYAIVAGVPARVVGNRRDVRVDSAVVKT